MTKKEVQQRVFKRVFKDGKPLALAKFKWNPKIKTFNSTGSGMFFEMVDYTFNILDKLSIKDGINDEEEFQKV